MVELEMDLVQFKKQHHVCFVIESAVLAKKQIFTCYSCNSLLFIQCCGSLISNCILDGHATATPSDLTSCNHLIEHFPSINSIKPQ